MIRHPLGALAVPILATGCLDMGSVNLAQVTSGRIGCPIGEISIADDRVAVGSRSWTAYCRGTTYYCSGVVGDPDSSPQVVCSPSAAGGRAGACVDPPAPR